MNDTTYSKADSIFALAMLVCGFLYWNLIMESLFGIGVTFYAVIFCLCTVIYLRAAGFRPTRKSLICLAVIALSAFVFTLSDNGMIKWLNLLFLMAVVIYWISVATGRTLEDRISVYMAGDFFQQALIVPFSNFGGCFGALKALMAGNQKGKSLLAGALGILIFLPVLAAVVNLLIEADAAFAGIIAGLHFTVSLHIIIEIIFGIPVACYLYGLIYGNRYGKNTGAVTLGTVDKAATALRFAPGVAVYSALTALNLIYIVFFLSQITYLFSAFNNHLPELMTYAEYARRGFFELCAVAAINLAVMAVAHLITKRGNGRVLKIQTVAICLFTLMLIATAMSKMVMYINSYGLTQMRVYTTWFMAALFFIFAVTAIRQFKKFNATRVIITGCVIFFMALSYGNVDGRIAAYNIDRYQNGTLESLDVQALGRLSAAAVPPMYDLYLNTGDEELKAQLREAIGSPPEHMFEAGYRDPIKNFNIQRQAAQNIRSQM